MENKIKSLIDKIIKEEMDKMLNEAPLGVAPPQSPAQTPVEKKPQMKPISKTPGIPPTNVSALPEKPVKKKPTVPMQKLEYQIFNIKMRMNKLGLSILSSRFNQSLKDFDLNVTKNSKDPEKINNYLLPVMGNLEALKNGLESLEGEFEKLQDLIKDDVGE